MMYPPSMIAAGSIGAAAKGLLQPISNHKLLHKLHQITNIDVVSLCVCVSLSLNFSFFIPFFPFKILSLSP